MNDYLDINVHRVHPDIFDAIADHKNLDIRKHHDGTRVMNEVIGGRIHITYFSWTSGNVEHEDVEAEISRILGV